jgi:hypothetical protein
VPSFEPSNFGYESAASATDADTSGGARTVPLNNPRGPFCLAGAVQWLAGLVSLLSTI